ELKRYGSDDVKAESNALLTATKKEIAKLDTDIEKLIAPFRSQLKSTDTFDAIKKSTNELLKTLKADKSGESNQSLQSVVQTIAAFKEITKAYNTRVKDSSILQTKLDSIDALLEEIGGMITTEESQKLI